MVSKGRVVFLHRAAHARSGSKIMRCDQLSSIAQTHLDSRFEFEVACLPRPDQASETREVIAGLSGAIVILLKRAHATLTPDQVSLLRDTARFVMIDYVDAGIDKPAMDIADLHIAASEDGARGLKRVADRLSPGRDIEVALVPHHADPRIRWRDRRADTEIKIGYFGLPDHAVIPPESAACVHSPDYGNGENIDEVIASMSDVNVHYAIRPPKQVRNSWKPFTKGINAAAAGANVLVHRGVDDAISLLGEDYPYLIDDASEAAIRDGIARVQSAAGSAEWLLGLDRMAGLRARLTPSRIAQDLSAALDRAD